MRSATTKQFWKCFDALPASTRQLAVECFERWKDDPYHPGLHFKELYGMAGLYSVRIGTGWRAIGRRREDAIYWIWIGSHADYDRLVSLMR